MSLCGARAGYKTRKAVSVRPVVELLEDRTLPSTITVTTASDALVHTGTSLRDALAQANAGAPVGISDTIVFDPGLAGATITLAQGQLVLSGAGGGTITIDGTSLSRPITISGNNASRVFQVDSRVKAVFANLTIDGGKAPPPGARPSAIRARAAASSTRGRSR